MNKNFQRVFYEKVSNKRNKVAMSITSSVIRSVLILMPTLLMRNIYNSIELGLEPRNVIGIIILNFVLPIIVAASYSLDIRLSKYIFVIIKEIRVQALSNVVNSKLRTILKQNKGELFNRIIVSLEELGNYYYYFINTTTWYITTSIVGIGIMFLINWQIAVVLLIFSLLQIGCSLVIQKKIEKVKARENQLHAKGVDYIRRIITQNIFIKTALLDDIEWKNEKEWESSSWMVCKLGIGNKQIIACLSFLITLMRTLYLFFAAYYLFLNNSMLKGDFIALNSYIVWLTPVFVGLQECIEDIIKSRENKHRVNDYLREDIPESEQQTVPDDVLKGVEVSHLAFSYEESKGLLFSDISFKVEAGETLYIVGASGVGKSTLLNVMLGLEPIYEGQVCYNGCELRGLDETWLHQNVIMVGQDVDILPSTLRENILYSGVQATDDEVIDILNSLKIGYLLEMPGGLDWDMKKYPRTLSDGERKRIAIARAILSKPKALLLDEPTAGLDNINKMAVTEFIEGNVDGLLIIVTHDHVYRGDSRIFYMQSKNAHNKDLGEEM